MTLITLGFPRLPHGAARGVAFVATLTVLGASPVAFAQTGEELSLRRLALERAEVAQRAGLHAEALELAERAGAIQMTPSVRFFIARELVSLGRRAEGLIAAQSCMREADQSTAANREAIRANCRQIADVTQPLVGTVTVRPPPGGPVAGLEVTVAGRPLGALVLGLPYYVDPGSVVVTARAPGRTSYESTVSVRAGGATNGVHDLPVPRAPVIAEPVAPPPPSPRDPAVRPPEPAPAPREPPAPSIAGPAVLWGVGGAAIVGGVVLLVLRQSALGRCESEPAINGVGQCPDEGSLSVAQSNVGYLGGAVGLLGAGVGALAGGVGWRAAQRGEAGERSVAVTPTRGGAVVSFGGAF